MLMKTALPKMGELLVMMMTMISPSRREVPPTESLRRRAKVLLPKFRLETATLCPESLLLIFLGQNDLYTRRWAPKVGRGGHNPPGEQNPLGRTLVGCAHPGPPPVPIFWYISPFDLEKLGLSGRSAAASRQNLGRSTFAL